MQHYILDADSNPVPSNDRQAIADLMLDLGRRTVAATSVGPFTVSTTFMVIDQSMGMSPSPVLWETMVSQAGVWIHHFTAHYSSLEDARQGHTATIHKLLRTL